MATLSNRDRVGKALDLLAEGLLPFVDPRMAAAAKPTGGCPIWITCCGWRGPTRCGAGGRRADPPQMQAMASLRAPFPLNRVKTR